jgi:hypothetical protein
MKNTNNKQMQCRRSLQYDGLCPVGKRYEMESVLIEKLKDTIKAINGDNENLISYDALSDTWSIEAVNDSKCVRLGEVSGDIFVEAPTLEEAVEKLAVAVEEYNNQK